MQIDPNTQAPLTDGTSSEDRHAPAPVDAGRPSKKRRKSATTRQNKVADLADVDVPERVADGTSSGGAVIEGTDLDAVVQRLRSGAYNTREVAEVIARRLLASGDL